MKNALLLFALFITVNLSAQRLSDPFKVDNETFDLLKKLSESPLSKGSIYLFTTTHQDIAWLDHPEACIINRDTVWLTPFLNRLANEPDFKMDIEQTSIVMEYIHRHPEKKALINKYLKEGRICIGATFMQPYEEMYSGESLARQFYLGNRWLKKEFDGYKPSSYFNVDVPGRTLQMPQIMRKAGVENLIISRHERGLFYWESPDGSKVRTYTPGHYIYFYNVLGMSDTAAIKELGKESVLWYTKYNDIAKSKTVMPAMLNYEFTWDQKPVANCIPFINKWNNLNTIQNESGKKFTVTLPKFKYAIADEFFATLDKSTNKIQSIKGERPNVWLYIHGPSHEHAITASRKGDIAITAAEKMWSFAALTDKSFARYPVNEFQKIWFDKIYPDHGWGGKNGIITDNTFLQKYRTALDNSQKLLKSSTEFLASHVDVKKEKGIPLVVFNSVSWQRTDPVITEVKFDEGFASNIHVYDAAGNKVTSQLSNVRIHNNGTINTAEICFVADVPSLGYQTYYLRPADTENEKLPARDIIDNKFYEITLVPGGVKQIKDKELNVNLLDASKFLGGEVITMQSIGNGAGEFDAVQMPDMEGFDKTSLYEPQWRLVEDGSVYTKYKYRSKIRNAVVEQTVKAYHQIKKIDFEISILNWEGLLYREYRMMIPLAFKGEVSYEVPYGMLTVGKDEMPGAAGERYKVENKDLHPRGIENWIGASGQSFGVTLSSSVAVADYIDPTTNPATNTILQPILLASRRSCHGEGNEYLQYGDHHYEFSLTSHKPGRENGFRFGRASNEKLIAVFNPAKYSNANLAEGKSLFNIKNNNVVISTIKKCEDDNSIIVRMYNLGESTEIVDFETDYKPKQIIKTNLIEEEKEEVNKITLGKYAIETYKLKY